jgi:RNA polymerase sigma factor (sigma-70 family)
MADAPSDDRLRAQLEALHAESWVWARVCCAGDAAQAEEVLHMTYHKVLDHRARFEGHSTFKTWLFGVIRLTAAQQRRWNWRRWLRWAPAEEADRRIGEETDGHDLLVQQERNDEVRAAIDKLSARQGEVMRLVFYHDLTLDEAAAVMGVSPGSARTHYERGKAQLRQCLSKQLLMP